MGGCKGCKSACFSYLLSPYVKGLQKCMFFPSSTSFRSFQGEIVADLHAFASKR
ncbi:hypothetical protein D3C76_440310 [compost metagenome]